MNSNRQCAHDWAGIMVLGIQAAQECRKCEAVLLQPDAANALFGSLASATTSAAMVEVLNSSELLTHEELQRFQAIYVECSGDEDWPSGAAIETAMADLFRSRASRTSPPHPTEVREAVPFGWAFQHEDTGRVAAVVNDGVTSKAAFSSLNSRWNFISNLYTHPATAAVDAFTREGKVVYTSEMGEAGQAYIDSFVKNIQPQGFSLPNMFRWQKLLEALLNATAKGNAP